MLKILRCLLPRRAGAPPDAPAPAAAPRFAVALPARLLLSLAPEGAPAGRRVIGSTLNVSETGLALVLPSPEAGGPGVSAGDRLDVQLEVYPAGVVGMMCEVVWHRPNEGGEGAGLVVGARISGMGHGDRARFLEYLATHGWEKASGGSTAVG